MESGGRNILRYTGGAVNTPEGGIFTGSPFEIVGDQLISDTATCNSLIPAKQRAYEDAPQCQQSMQNFFPDGSQGTPAGGETCTASRNTGSYSYFHADHNHWHASNIYEFSLHGAQYDSVLGKKVPSPTPLFDSNKVTYCLIDWVALISNNGNNGNTNVNNGKGNDRINQQAGVL